MNPIENKNRPKLKGQTYAPVLFDGKLQPQATDLEEAVLGAIMLEKEALSNVIDILKPESFYKPAHVHIYRSIMELFNSSEPVDILTVTKHLQKTGNLDLVGGAYYISHLTNRVASSANVEFHARIVAQKFLQRELIRISTDTINKAYEDSTDVFDLLDTATKNIFEVVDSNVRKQHDKMSSLISLAIEQIEAASQQVSGVTGVPTGFTALDRITSGWQKSDLVILAARPGMGKTAFVLTIARNAAVDFNRPTVVFSLEMSSIQLVNRLISGEAELDQVKLRKGQLEDHEWVQLNSRIKKLSVAPLYIDDTPALSIFELRAKARRLKENNNIELIIIDYLQLMSGGSETKGNREQEISHISRSLKSLAKELNIPIIALSQLSRNVEQRATGSKRPQLSDLRESGAIEQDADMVNFIYRPDYYKLDTWEDGQPCKNQAEIIIAKHRNGSLEEVRLRFIGQFAKFADLDYDENSSQLYNASSGLTPSNEFLQEEPRTKTIASKNWDDDTITGSNDIIRGNPNNDIDEVF
ncbi:MAG: replicative DNA helicase [Bacteroidia bacterium]